METTISILWRNTKWRFQNPISIFITVVQPLIWLVLYSMVAKQSMQTNLGVNYTSFILPGIMVLVILACCSSGGYLNFIMKSKGSFYRILIAPVNRRSIVLGQMLESVLLSFIEITIMLLLAMLMSVKISSGFMGMLFIVPIVLLAALFMSGISYAISLYLPNEAIYETIMNIIVLSVFFTSSSLFPMNNISGKFKIIVMMNPFTYVINVLRGLILDNQIDYYNILIVIGLFAILSLGSFSLAIYRLKKLTVN
ncbi:ABC transporter permease [Clostridiaceae bacterium M8S5]|nr:ABC transporter permease [Clostridiaceae bacterium M8S5]